MNDTDGLRYEVEDPVAVITLERPEALNAFTWPMLVALRDRVADAVADPKVVGIIITGTGRGFSVGLDATAMTSTTAGVPVEPVAHGHGRFAGMFSYLLEQPKPIIAAINGVTAGGGFLLATMCDLRFAAEDSSFVTVFSRRGLIGELGVTWTLPRLVGTGNALDLLWSSRRIEAAEAHRLGLVEKVTPPGELLCTAKDYVGTLAQEVAPTALAETKRLVYDEAGMGVDAALRQAYDATNLAMRQPDAMEGAAAFLERRRPSFSRVGSGRPPLPATMERG